MPINQSLLSGRAAVSALLIALCVVLPAHPAEPPVVITSPTNGKIVHPGDTLSVTVRATRQYIHMWIIGEDP